MNDPSLQPGDIIATGQGFVVFVGREVEHQPNDFVPAPDLGYRPLRGHLRDPRQHGPAPD